MNCSRALKWFVVLLLPLTLGWKALLYSNDSNDPTETSEDRVAKFLASHQYNLAGIQKMTGEMQIVRATAGYSCKMLVAQTSSRGWHRDMIRELAAPEDQTFVVFHGKVYSDQPMFLTITDFLWRKFLSQLGLKVSPTVVLSVIATKECDAARLPWQELG